MIPPAYSPLASLERICHCDRHGLFTLSVPVPELRNETRRVYGAAMPAVVVAQAAFQSPRFVNSSLLALRECESLIIGPARDSSDREGISGVFAGRIVRPLDQSVLIKSCDRSPGGAPTTLGGEDSVVQNHIEQRFMNPDVAVILNKAELAKAIHEEADA